MGYLVPAGIILLVAGASHPSKTRGVAVSGLLGAAAGLVGYVAIGFGIEFGGLGLVSEFPGAEALRREVPPIVWGGRVVGREWGVLGLGGLVLLEGGLSRDLLVLALHQGAAAAGAAAIAAVAVAGGARLGASAGIGAATGALLHPLLGNWLWGGGWLGRLGESLALGVGTVDGSGASATFAVGAIAGLAGILAWEDRQAEGRDPSQPPTAELPLIAASGALLVASGWAGQSLIGPPFAPVHAGPATGINLVLGASAGALATGLYLGFVRGEVGLLLAARGLMAGLIAVSCGAALFSPVAALAVGAGAGVVLPLATYLIESRLRLDEDGVGLGGLLSATLWGLLAVGLVADGSGGVVGILTLGMPGGQLGAQLLATAGLAVLGTATWIGMVAVDRGLGLRDR